MADLAKAVVHKKPRGWGRNVHSSPVDDIDSSLGLVQYPSALSLVFVLRVVASSVLVGIRGTLLLMVSCCLLAKPVHFPKNPNLGKTPHGWTLVGAFLKYQFPGASF